ncbi:MAG: serine hydrolase domain-containing protein [Bacteroidota bacterium]
MLYTPFSCSQILFRPFRDWTFQLLLLFPLLLLTCSPKLAPPSPGDVVGHLIEQYRTENKIPGLSVAVLQGGELVYAKGFGYADVAKKRPANENSVYLTASISKAVGGTLAAKLEAEGKLKDGTPVSLDMDQPTTAYLDIPRDKHAHTVAQLSAHLSCIRHYNGSSVPKGHFAMATEAVEVLKNDSLIVDCTIGGDRNYSTHAFTYFGAVLEKVTGRPIAQLVEEELSEAYGFSSIRAMYRYPTLRPNVNRVTPYNLEGKKTAYEQNSWKVLGGGIEASAIDLVRFAYAIEQGEIISPEVRDNRLWKQLDLDSPNGIAWELGAANGRPTVEHAGSAHGSRCLLRVYRGENPSLVICVLTNSQINGHDPAKLVDQIAEEFLPEVEIP